MNCLDQSVTTRMQSAVVTVKMEDTILTVEQVMEEHDVSSVPVLDPERHDCFGVISLKDIHHFHSMGRLPRAYKAWEICSYKPHVVTVDSTVREAVQLLLDHRVHHLAVNNLHNKLVGYISSLDVLEALYQELQHRRSSDSPL